MLWSLVTPTATVKPKTQSIEQKTETYLAKRACDGDGDGLNTASAVRCKATNCLNDGAMCRDRYNSSSDFSTTYSKLTAHNYNNSYSQFSNLTFKCNKRKEFCYDQCLDNFYEIVVRFIVKMLSDLVNFSNKLSKAYVLAGLVLITCCGNVCARPNISNAASDTRSTNWVSEFSFHSMYIT